MNAAQRFVEDEIHRKPPMEVRIAKLESDVEHIKDVMDDIKLDVREIRAANDGIAVLQKEVGVISATMVTKAELNKLEGELKTSISNVHGELKTSISNVHGELKESISHVHGALDARINAMESRIQRWVVVTGLGAAALALAVAKFPYPPAADPPEAIAIPTLPAAQAASREQTK